MPISIQEHLNTIKYTQLSEEFDKLHCSVTLCHGRKFSLDSCEGEISFNDIVACSLEKAKNYAGDVNGEALHERLIKVHAMGEAELAAKPLYVRIWTHVMRLFTFWNRYWKLGEIESMSGHNSVDGYAKAHIPALLPNVPAASLRFTPVFSSINGVNTRNLKIEIDFEQGKTYLGLDRFKTQGFIDESKTLQENCQELVKKIEKTLPTWLKAKEAAPIIVQELKRHVQAHALQSITVGADVNPVAVEQGFVRYTFDLQFVGRGNPLRLTSDPVAVGESGSIDRLVNSLKETLDSKLAEFFGNQHRGSPFSADFDDIFSQFFGGGFSGFGFGFNFFEGVNSPNSSLPQGDTLKESLQQLDELLEKPARFTTLYANKEYQKIIDEIKAAYKVIYLRIHPDKVRQNGGSEEEINAATEKFQLIDGLVKSAVEELKKK